MRTILLVVSDSALRTRLLRAFAECSVFVAHSDADALRTLGLVEVDILIRDAGARRDLNAFISKVREVAPSAATVAIGPSEDEASAADFALGGGFTQRELEAVLRQIGDRQSLSRQVAALRAQVVSPPTPVVPGLDTGRDSPGLTRVLKEFSRLIAAGFNLPRMLQMFLDAVGELLRPTRSAVLLPDNTGEFFRIAAHRGLAPQIVESVRLSATGGLGRWLASQGRPARLQELDPDVARELMVLQGVVAVPLLTRGDLVAMLIVGQPVIGGTYARDETEILFELSTQLATAIRDITLHNHLQREKEFNELILAHMSNGVITIGRDQKITTLNRRAEEILMLPAHEIIDHDLRGLPSPLGDMLFETLTLGRCLPRSEIQLALRNLWLEVSTYPIHGNDPAPLGAVLVFEDLTAQKELAAQKRQAEEFLLLARVVARIADEIKNPLVSVNTFVELIDERFEDPDFRKLFTSVVRRDVRRLVQVFEKLAALVSEGELNFATVDVHTIVDEVVTAIEASDEGAGKHVQLDVSRAAAPQMVKADASQLCKAMSYLIWYLSHHSAPDDVKVSVSVGRQSESDGTEKVRLTISSRTAIVPADKLQRLFDPVRMVQESLIDVGPAVSQRLIEAQGGQLRVRQHRQELSFLVALPAVC